MKINIYLLLFFTSFGASFTHAQEVLLDKAPRVSGFVSITPMVSSFDDQLAYSQSASVAAIFNQKFYIGFFAESLWTRMDRGLYQNNDCCEPAFGSTGLMIGSIIKPKKLIHFDVRAKVGLGALRVTDNSSPSTIFGDFDSDYEPVFVAHPSAGVEINITKFFKLNTHVGYRYIGHIDDNNISRNSMNGITGQIGLVFGWFGSKKDKTPQIDPDDDSMRL